MIVMAGEFGRTPRVSPLIAILQASRAHHWGPCRASSSRAAASRAAGRRHFGPHRRFPLNDPQTPESMAATIYHCLGIPQTRHVNDAPDRPHHIYHGEPIKGLVSHG